MGYDPAGRLVDLVTPGMTATHGYDARGRLAALNGFGFEYDDAGRISALNRPNGVTTFYEYNAAGQNTAIDSGVHAIFTAYDERALPVSMTDQEGVHGYEHDVLGRLIAVDHPLGAAFADEAYSYDAADRRTSNGAEYDEADRLIEDADFTYTYDDEGRRTSRTAKAGGALTTYEWNVLDQLVALEEGMVRWEYTYDARDLRVRVSNDAGYDERFVYDANGTVRATFDGSGTLSASYLAGFGFGELLAEGGGERYALRDRLGSTAAWLTATGQVEAHVVRDAYGVRQAPTESVEPFGYTGHAEDPSGLVWARARYLDPSIGRFVTEDSVQSEPRYCYAGSRPTTSSDPTGMAEAIQAGSFGAVWVAPSVSTSQVATVGALVGLGALGATLSGELDCLGHFLACLKTPLGSKRPTDPQFSNQCAECMADCNRWTGWPMSKKCSYNGL
jgi:RHS repeat-associated protein